MGLQGVPVINAEPHNHLCDRLAGSLWPLLPAFDLPAPARITLPNIATCALLARIIKGVSHS
jgi:hypothetical protein